MKRSAWNQATSPQEAQVQKLLDEIDRKLREDKRRLRQWAKVSYSETRASMDRSSSAEATDLARQFNILVEGAVNNLAASLGRPPKDMGRMIRAELSRLLGDATR